MKVIDGLFIFYFNIKDLAKVTGNLLLFVIFFMNPLLGCLRYARHRADFKFCILGDILKIVVYCFVSDSFSIQVDPSSISFTVNKPTYHNKDSIYYPELIKTLEDK